MSISSKDIKKLWGLAAGRCSRPGCDDECIRFLAEDPTVIGEMAHVIAQSPKGPRGVQQGGEDTYENLILLCPTDHSEIDNAPAGTFPAELLRNWKKQHEAEVATAFVSPIFPTVNEMGRYIKRLLVENEAAWKTYGPESVAAQSNPISSLSEVWPLRKLGTIVPNNRKIINAIQRNSALIEAQLYAACCLFVEHAEGFERNCYGRTENVPLFPKEFAEVIEWLYHAINWGVSYSSIRFFEGALEGHSKVESFRRRDDIVFEVELKNGSEIKVLLVNEYTLGLAAILKAQAEFPDVEYIVTCADWNGYTREAKEYGKENNLGVFTAGEFFGALNWSEPKKYYKKDSDGRPVYHYKSS